MQDLSNRCLMMFEPPLEAQTERPLEDGITQMADVVMKGCRKSKIAYKGWHTSSCGKRSDNRDHITPMGRTTHSLMPHYVRHFREAIPPSEIHKLAEEFEMVSNCVEEGAEGLVTKGFREQLRRAADFLVKTQDSKVL